MLPHGHAGYPVARSKYRYKNDEVTRKHVHINMVVQIAYN